MKNRFLLIQKILIFVPFFNFLIFFIWGIHQIYLFNKITYKKHFEIGFVTIGVLFIVTTLETALLKMFLESFWYMDIIITYIYGVTIGVVCLISEIYANKCVDGTNDENNQ